MTFTLNLVSFLVVFVALVRIVTTPVQLWAHGRISKTAWVISSLWFTFVVHGVWVPAAAVTAIAYTHRINHRPDPTPKVPDLPFAQGEPESVVSKEES